MMFPVKILILAVFPCVWSQSGSEEKQENKATIDQYPNCHLVTESYVSFKRNKTGHLIVDFSWDPKEDNYKEMDESTISSFWVRHGPMENGGVVDATAIVVEIKKPKGNSFTLTGVIPNQNYGLQICAVTDKYPLQEDAWEHAWVGGMDLVNFWGNGFPGPEVPDGDEELYIKEGAENEIIVDEGQTQSDDFTEATSENATTPEESNENATTPEESNENATTPEEPNENVTAPEEPKETATDTVPESENGQ